MGDDDYYCNPNDFRRPRPSAEGANANDAADPDDKVDKDEDHSTLYCSVTRAISSEVFHIPNVIPQLNEMQL